MIDVTDVSKSYGPIPALREVSFHVDAGEVIGLLGPNGAGKTTMLYDARAEVTAWVDPVYFAVPRDQIVALTLENANGRFEFEKDADDAWTMEGLGADETLNSNNVNSLVNRITSVQMQRPLGLEEQTSYGFDAPSAAVTVLTRDAEGQERTHILRVGAQQNEGEDAGYVVKSATSPYYVLAADYTVSSMIERTRQDFLEMPPTPEPTAEPTPAP